MDFLGKNYLKICDFLIIFPFDIKKRLFFLKAKYPKTEGNQIWFKKNFAQELYNNDARAHVCKKPKTRLLFVALSI